MHSILGQGLFSTNYSISEVWHGSDQPMALLRHYWAFSSSVLLDRLLLIFLLKISIPVACCFSSLLLVHFFLPNFFFLVNFAFNMLWYSTLWTATTFSNDLLWITLFAEGVNDCFLDHCQVSSLPHYCGFKEKEIPRIYTVGVVW